MAVPSGDHQRVLSVENTSSVERREKDVHKNNQRCTDVAEIYMHSTCIY